MSLVYHRGKCSNFLRDSKGYKNAAHALAVVFDPQHKVDNAEKLHPQAQTEQTALNGFLLLHSMSAPKLHSLLQIFEPLREKQSFPASIQQKEGVFRMKHLLFRKLEWKTLLGSPQLTWSSPICLCKGSHCASRLLTMEKLHVQPWDWKK